MPPDPRRTDAPTRIARRVVYRGRVQGVGFRYTARHVAARFAVTGWVRNLPDGTVELLAEGEPREVDRFLDALRDEMSGFIRDEQRVELTATGAHHSFDIRH